MQVYTEKSDGIKMKFDSGSGRHGNDIEDIAWGFSWEGACEAMKTHLYNKGYVSVSCCTDLISHPTYLTALSFSILVRLNQVPSVKRPRLFIWNMNQTRLGTPCHQIREPTKITKSLNANIRLPTKEAGVVLVI